MLLALRPLFEGPPGPPPPAPVFVAVGAPFSGTGFGGGRVIKKKKPRWPGDEIEEEEIEELLAMIGFDMD